MKEEEGGSGTYGGTLLIFSFPKNTKNTYMCRLWMSYIKYILKINTIDANLCLHN